MMSNKEKNNTHICGLFQKITIHLMKGLYLKVACLTLIGATFFSSTSLDAQCIRDNSGKWISQQGGDCVNTILTAVPFLRIVSDARSGAMGDHAGDTCSEVSWSS